MATRLGIATDHGDSEGGTLDVTNAMLTPEQAAFLEQVVTEWSVADIPADLAHAAAWCIEELRRQTQAEGDQDGPGE